MKLTRGTRAVVMGRGMRRVATLASVALASITLAHVALAGDVLAPRASQVEAVKEPPAEAGGRSPTVAPSPPPSTHTSDSDRPLPRKALSEPAARVSLGEELVDPARVMAMLRRLPTKRAAFGDDAHKAGLRAMEKLVFDELTAMGLKPVLDPADAMGAHAPAEGEGAKPEPWNSIIVDLPGTTRAKEVVLFSAHIDAVVNAPGADDDGSGVVALLEAARILRDRPMQRTVRLAFFNLEEVGLIGSRAYAQRLAPKLDAGEETVVGMASLDMLGYFCDEPGCQTSPIPDSKMFTAPKVGDFLGVASVLRFRGWARAFDAALREAEPKLKTVVVDFLPIAPPDLMRSDHAPFWGINVPALIIADTANFRNPNYHRATDTVETIDQTRYVQAVRAIVGGLERLAGPKDGRLIPLAAPSRAKDEPKPAEAPTP